MRRFFALLCIALIMIGLFSLAYWYYSRPQIVPISSIEVEEYHRILDRYSFERLRTKTRLPSSIEIGRVLKQDPNFTSYLFTFLSDGKTVSGQLNLPVQGENLPVIVMARGYVDKEIYYTGLGTRTAGEAFARAGYITVAPDFLGYGESDQESFDIFEARFEKPATILNLIASLSTIPQANPAKVGIWGHSNGGQISISVLEISQQFYPTVLWAPVTQRFPASILQYVDELPDKGTYIKNQLNLFHERYLDEDYDIGSHVAEITAPLQIHQGSADELVLESYTADFVDRLRDNNIAVEYFTYPGENHNFNNGSVITVVERNVEFFDRYLR